MAKTTVYRVEDGRGQGPYNGDGRRLHSMNRAHSRGGYKRERTPPPQEDGIQFYGMGGGADSSHYFGFESIGDALAWFDGYAQSLHENGYQLAMYAVPEESVIFGGKQLVFVKDDAERVGVLDLGSDRKRVAPRVEQERRERLNREIELTQAQARMYAEASKPFSVTIEKNTELYEKVNKQFGIGPEISGVFVDEAAELKKKEDVGYKELVQRFYLGDTAEKLAKYYAPAWEKPVPGPLVKELPRTKAELYKSFYVG